MKIVLGSPLDHCNEWYFESWCKFHSRYCDKLVIFFDNNKQQPSWHTLAIAELFDVSFNYIHEPFYETRVWKKVLEKCLSYEPDWVGLLAVDSIFTKNFFQLKDKMFNESVAWYGFPIYHFWESEEYIRVDGVFGSSNGMHMKVFLKSDNKDINFYKYEDKEMHGNHFPINIEEKDGKNLDHIKLKHMGYVKKDAWNERCLARGISYGDINQSLGVLKLEKWSE